MTDRDIVVFICESTLNKAGDLLFIFNNKNFHLGLLLLIFDMAARTSLALLHNFDVHSAHYFRGGFFNRLVGNINDKPISVLTIKLLAGCQFFLHLIVVIIAAARALSHVY